MIVYCYAIDCKHNKNAMCHFKSDYNIEAIIIGEQKNATAPPMCTDYCQVQMREIGEADIISVHTVKQ